MQSGGSAPGARWAGSGLPLPFGAETPLPLPLAQQPALGAGGWCGRGVPFRLTGTLQPPHLQDVCNGIPVTL